MPNKHEIFHLYRNFPLKITFIYVLITFLLSIVGPVKYYGDGYNYWIVMFFLLGVFLCLYSGYYIGLRTMDATPIKKYQGTVEIRVSRLMDFSILVSLISVILEFWFLLSIGHLSIGLADLGLLYTTRIEESSTPILLFRFLSSPLRMITLSLGMLRFKQLSQKFKTLFVSFIILYIVVFLFGYGNQKGVSDILIYFSVAFFINRILKGKKMSKKAMRIILICVIGVLLLFSHMQYLGYTPRGIDASNYHIFSTGDFYYDTNHLIFKLLGDDLGFGMATILNGYLSQGYYGLSLCMELPFEWSYGLGSSYAITGILSKLGISGIYEQTYLGRMQDYFVRDGLRAWNTIFPWIASDFTWVGAMLFFILVGYMMAKSWKELILYNNIISYLLFVSTVILVIFIPANNQLFHGYDSFLTTWTIIILWITQRGKYSRE